MVNHICVCKSIGCSQAKEVADLYEKHYDGPELETEMDNFNNQKGRDAYTAIDTSSSKPSETAIKLRIQYG